MKYRREIDGLRTIAVVPVVLFHAGFKWLSGGYVGVDVFFVISGFLITTVLIDELEAGNFSIVRFYERRARRILPALFLVVLCCIPFAWAWMLPVEFNSFSKSVAAVVVFASNIIFWREEGYFSAAAELKPLLHTWSLAVEEQYYLFFPIALAFIWRKGKNITFWLIIVSSVLSILLCEWTFRAYPSANFYLAPTRMWELFAGSAAALLAHGKAQRSSNFLSALGLAAIIAAMLIYDNDTPIPSFYALAPVGGAVLIILFAGSNTWVARILSTRPLVGIGLISYSIYLWHQPLFAFARIRSLGEPPTWLMSAFVLLTVVLAYLTWRFVEQPFRSGPKRLLSSRSSLFIASAVGSAVLICFSAAGLATDGFPSRWDSQRPALDAITDIGKYRNECLGSSFQEVGRAQCFLGATDKEGIDFILLGDSFAAAIADGIDVAASAAGKRGMLIATSACPTVLDVGGTYKPSLKDCEDMQAKMISLVIQAKTKKVFLASAWRIFDLDRVCGLSLIKCNEVQDLDGYVYSKVSQTIEAFNAQGIEVIFIGVPPTSDFEVPRAMLFSGNGREVSAPMSASYPIKFTEYLDRVGKFNGEYIDIRSEFCAQGTCRLAEAGMPFMFDAAHLTGTKSRQLAHFFTHAMQ